MVILLFIYLFIYILTYLLTHPFIRLYSCSIHIVFDTFISTSAANVYLYTLFKVIYSAICSLSSKYRPVIWVSVYKYIIK
jgi:hypothetical protein